MTDRLHLPPPYRRILEGLLREHVPEAEVWAYGNRIAGESHEGSDLDLVVRGHDLKPLDDGFFDLLEAIEQTNIPILVKVHDWARLSESFHREIERDYVVLQYFARSEVDGLLSEWQWVQFGDCAELIRDSVSPSEMGESLYVGLEHIGEGTLSLTGHGIARDVTSTKSRFRRGDILFGKLRPYFRKVVRAPDKGVCSTDIWVVRGRDGVNQDFLYYCMASQEFVDFAMAGSEGTRMPRANWEHVSRYNIALPPLPEQRAIAHILGTLDDKIELNRRMNETLEEMARALFKSWFVDFDPVRAKVALASAPSEESDWTRERARAYLDRMDKNVVDFFPDQLVDSELGEIPEGWEVKALGELVDFAYGKALKANDRKPGAIPVYGSNGRVGWHNQGIVAGPGIVVGRKGNPGIVTWVHSDFFPIDTTFYVIPKDSINRLCFLFFALAAQDLPSVSADSAVPGLNRNLAYMNQQLVPDKTVLEEFDNIVGAIFSRRHDLEEESRALSAKRDLLLPGLMTGQLTVVEWGNCGR